ncbi:hypothetical protein [Marinibactrum halimedae]|uniref:Uncharacterized protein n=1 Tax=Marinibactrum halimedae TaxID=1444977 RepID=A0AA37T6E0_9GAMM|nr:hypothetical protein [Marinibactrum halimedae]MCD9460679.1 hypothetical protein [Marinibactrum halimedae]GLS24325.1 hypothetical protein GCM10007877_00360 [Marinibactrum halimedae]
MQSNNANVQSLHVHYSPTAKYSVGYRGEYWRNDQFWLHTVQANSLLRRWNGTAYQANVYMKSGVGVAHFSGATSKKNSALAAFTGLAMDWENRHYFISYENRLYSSRKFEDFTSHNFRVGIAPYVGDYGDFHTWFMVQLDYLSHQNDSMMITPLIRIFKNEYLAELGVNKEGDFLANVIIRF